MPHGHVDDGQATSTIQIGFQLGQSPVVPRRRAEHNHQVGRFPLVGRGPHPCRADADVSGPGKILLVDRLCRAKTVQHGLVAAIETSEQDLPSLLPERVVVLARAVVFRSGQQYDIWEATYSPMGEDGYPVRLWDKETGEIDHEVAAYWRENYDLRHILERDWATLGPKLEGKLHIYTGDMDNFYLNNAVMEMEAWMRTTENPHYPGFFMYGRGRGHCYSGPEVFPVILIHHFMDWPVYKERWTQEMLSAIMQNYAPTDVLAETIVYQPTEVGMGEITVLEVCPGAPWRLPTSGTLGMWWITYQLAFMGEGYENRVPVYAVADGLLMRRSDWNDAVAILHDDPVRQGEKVWSFYGGMANSMDEQSFVVSDFPPDSVGVPVNAGQLLGYQGMWSGEQGAPIWVHLHFAVVAALEDGSFPEEIVSLVAEGEQAKTEPQFALDPSPYLGTIRSQIMGIPTWLPLRCLEDMP